MFFDFALNVILAFFWKYTSNLHFTWKYKNREHIILYYQLRETLTFFCKHAILTTTVDGRNIIIRLSEIVQAYFCTTIYNLREFREEQIY